MKLKASIGLELKDGDKDWNRVLELKLPAIKPNSCLELPLKMYAELPNIKDCTNLEHNVIFVLNFVLIIVNNYNRLL